MQPTFKNEIDKDMGAWFDELQARKVTPSGIPSGAKIETEVLRLTKEEFGKLLENPQEFVSQRSSDNAANASTDELFR